MTAGDLPPLQGAELTDAISPDAFAQLYDSCAERALRIARAICRDQRRAEDVVQEGFMAIWRNRADYRPEAGSFQAWSMKIVKRRAIDSVAKTSTKG